MVTTEEINRMIWDAFNNWRYFEEAAGKQALIDLQDLLVRRKPERSNAA